MEQKTQQQMSIVIKEEITDVITASNFSAENTATGILRQSKVGNIKRPINDPNDLCCISNSMKMEKNKLSTLSSPIGMETNSRNTSSPKFAVGTSRLAPVLPVVSNGDSKSVDSLSPLFESRAVPNNDISTMETEYEYTLITSKNLFKIKRLLSTLLQFASMLNADVGKAVKNLIFNLACDVISIEEFHSSLQDAISNFPLRPFVLPFLKNYVPILQKEINLRAKLTKQSAELYVRQNENSILGVHVDSFCTTPELNSALNQTSDPTSINNQQHENPSPNKLFTRKRRYECFNTNVMCHKADPLTNPQIQQTPPLMKKQVPYYIGNSHQPFYYPVEYFQIPPPPFLSNENDWSSSTCTSSAKYCNSAGIEEKMDTRNGQWDNINMMLNCILSMVEKTKRALTILQEQNTNELGNGDTDGVNLNGSNSNQNFRIKRTEGDDVKETVDELMAHTVRLTEKKVAFVRKKAEEAVNEVKREAILELQEALTEYKSMKCKNNSNSSKGSHENKKLIKSDSETEHSAQNNFSNGYKLGFESSSLFYPLQTDNCWNCGRKAEETCSGCSLAKYCGTFCQHKDWESHHQICNGYINSMEINLDKGISPRKSFAETFISRPNGFDGSISKPSNLKDLSNGIDKGQTSVSELYGLLPFSINSTSVKMLPLRATNSRPPTPIITTSNSTKGSPSSKTQNPTE